MILVWVSASISSSALATRVGDMLSSTAATPEGSDDDDATIPATATAASSSCMSISVAASTSAFPPRSSGDMDAITFPASAADMAARDSRAFSSLIALTAAAAEAPGRLANTCDTAPGYMPFIMRATASGLCPMSASAACSGGRLESACAEALGSSFGGCR